MGLIGDVHCEHQSLELAIQTLLDLGVETIVCTGDLPTGPGDINACCDQLRRHKIPTVRGNHDRWLLDLTVTHSPFATPPSAVSMRSWRYLNALPVTIELPTPGGLAQLCHGLDREDMLAILPDQSDLELDDHPFLQALVQSRRFRWIIGGHSHRRMARRYGPLTMINAGTLRRDHNPCFGAIDFETHEVRFWDIVDQSKAVPAGTISLK